MTRVPRLDAPHTIGRRLIEAGLAISVNLSYGIGGAPLSTMAIGADAKGSLVTEDGLCRLDCAGKPLISIAAHILDARGVVSLDAPVSRYIPEYGANGKGGITFLDLLSHSVGRIRPPQRLYRHPNREVLQALYDWPAPDASSGTGQNYYDTWAGWLILAEVIERVSNSSWSDVVYSLVLEPAGLSDSFDLEHQFNSEAVARYVSGKLQGLPFYDLPSTRAVANPAYGVYASMPGLARLYQVLGNAGACKRIWGFSSSRLVETHRERVLDTCLHFPAASGAGVLLGLSDWNFAPELDSDSFGYSGSSGTWGLYDRSRNLSVALRINGLHPSIGLSKRENAAGNPLLRSLCGVPEETILSALPLN